MTELTLQRNYELLEQLTEYVTTELPNLHGHLDQIDGRLDQMDGRLEFMEHSMQSILRQLADKADKSEIAEIKENVDYIIIIMDGMCKKQEEMNTEQKAFTAGFYRLEEQVDVLKKKINA